MSVLESILLGVVQGLGEFLPISSSAHLVIFPWFFDFKTPGLSFDVALHFGTLISLLVYFYQDWIQLTRAFFSSIKKKGKCDTIDERMIWYIIFGSVPAALVGLTVEEYAETIFRNPWLVAFNMSFFGILLYAADRWGKKNKGIAEMGFWDAMIVGLAQALALVPGTSRSGVTITAGMFRGIDRVSAARFSFLLSTPVVAGAAMLKAKDFFALGFSYVNLIGIAVSAVVGYLAIKYMLHFLKSYSFLVYVIYRLAFAAIIMVGLWWKSGA